MSNKGMWGWLIGLVVVIALVVMGQQGVFSSHKDYQAVFLTNGQLYFGKLSHENSGTVVLKDIFYLRAQKQVQPVPEGETAPPPQVQIVKLGGELHGPTDRMEINRSSILYIEDLKEDKDDKGDYVSRVRRAIDNFHNNKTSPSASPSPSAS